MKKTDTGGEYGQPVSAPMPRRAVLIVRLRPFDGGDDASWSVVSDVWMHAKTQTRALRRDMDWRLQTGTALQDS